VRAFVNGRNRDGGEAGVNPALTQMLGRPATSLSESVERNCDAWLWPLSLDRNEANRLPMGALAGEARVAAGRTAHRWAAQRVGKELDAQRLEEPATGTRERARPSEAVLQACRGRLAMLTLSLLL
jgi:hypothetical protein